MDRADARFDLLGEQLLLPVDRARAAWNRLVLGSALGRGLVRKDTRIAVRGIASIAVAFALTVLSPLFSFAVAPVVLGVPHLAADLRYLVLQPRYGGMVRALLVAGCVPFVALRIAPLAGVHVAHDAPIEMALATSCLLVAAIAAAVSARRFARLAIVAPTLLAVGILAFRHAEGARVAFAHLHNVVAIVLWAVLFRAKKGARRALVLPVACAAAATVAIVAYGLTSAADLGAQRAFGVQLATLAAWLAPGLSARAGIALVLTYVFLQSVHYSIWLGLIPAEAVRGDAARSFRMSLRALVRDFGAVGLAMVALAVTGTIVLATRSLGQTRDTYLTLSAFHGYLELAVLVIASCGRRDLWTARLAPAQRGAVL